MQAFIKNRAGFWTCRALLGVIEGGFIPDVILYLSYYYTTTELPRRLSFFWLAYQSTNIVSAVSWSQRCSSACSADKFCFQFLAYGILRINQDGLYGWQWLFALEGMVTGVVGIVTWFYLPPSPYQTASWFRGKNGWFTEREEKIMANRILRDDPSKGDMHNRQGLSLKAIIESLSDYHMWPIYLIGLSWLLPTVPMQGYITLNLVAEGFGTFETNLLVIPAFFLFILGLLVGHSASLDLFTANLMSHSSGHGFPKQSTSDSFFLLCRNSGSCRASLHWSHYRQIEVHGPTMRFPFWFTPCHTSTLCLWRSQAATPEAYVHEPWHRRCITVSPAQYMTHSST